MVGKKNGADQTAPYPQMSLDSLKMVQTARAGVGGTGLATRRDGDDDVRAFFVVDTIHVETDYAFVDAELGALAGGQNDGVPCVLRANVEYHAVRFKNVPHAGSRGRFALRSTSRKVCLNELAGLVRREIAGISSGRECKNGTN